MKPFLILQLRPETEAADDEFAALLDKGGIAPERAVRVRLEREALPAGLDLAETAGVIVGGGPGCVSDPPAAKSPEEARIEAACLGLIPEILARDHPYLGCCYGIGILAHAMGGTVAKGRYGEPVGAVTCEVTEEGRRDPLLAGLPERFDAFVGHKEAVEVLPEGAVALLGSAPCPYQMIRAGRNVYATQFHPEADAAVFETRIRVYRDRGYFPPGEADALVAMCRAAEVEVPQRILRRFVERYG
ncbi:glutamine amidotransferase [Oceanicola granulosus HTCC2516]|uniref:Glutamine amidotransferase n=1 Tax=Oceanicola granulosus (strain ATCC BAA-861 / DSM 15982 / KCTC 12143 / HTCC2516) TaxID=314256 RepID=Q2CAT0_OCEGH|nr:glutamine amidotransferase [Oceanicola granulosus]EAR49758.1 glutamine amidotransferase [Oceanicola granulosus HTCC2516]